MDQLRFTGIVRALDSATSYVSPYPSLRFYPGVNLEQNMLIWKLNLLLTLLRNTFSAMPEPVLTLDEEGLVQAMWRDQWIHLEVEINHEEIVWFAKDRIKDESQCLELPYSCSGLPNLHVHGLLNQIIYRKFTNTFIQQPAYYIHGTSGSKRNNDVREIGASMLSGATFDRAIRANVGRPEREYTVAFGV